WPGTWLRWGAGAVGVQRGGQGLPPAGYPDLEHVLRRSRRLPPSRTATSVRDGSGVRDVEGPEPGTAHERGWGRQDPPGRPRPGRAGTSDVPSAPPHLPDPAP